MLSIHDSRNGFMSCSALKEPVGFHQSEDIVLNLVSSFGSWFMLRWQGQFFVIKNPAGAGFLQTVYRRNQFCGAGS